MSQGKRKHNTGQASSLDRFEDEVIVVVSAHVASPHYILYRCIFPCLRVLEAVPQARAEQRGR